MCHTEGKCSGNKSLPAASEADPSRLPPLPHSSSGGRSRSSPKPVSAEGTPANKTAVNNAALWSEVEGHAKTKPLGKRWGGSCVPACRAGGQTSPHRLAAVAGAVF